MRRALIIGYAFHPRITPTSYHTEGILNGLCKNGYAVDLILPKDSRKNDFWDEAPPGLTIHLIDMKRLTPFQWILKIFFWLFLRPSGFAFAYCACKYVKQNGLDKNADVLLTIADPFVTHLTGMLIKSKNKKLQWVADYGDPYTYSPHILQVIEKGGIIKKVITGCKMKGMCLLEKRAVKHMSRIVIPIEAAKNSYYKVNATDEQIVVIPQLFEYKFEETAYNLFDDEKINILFAGSFYKDIRHPGEFLAAYKQLIEEEKPLAFHFFGDVEQFEAFLSELGPKKEKYNIFANKRIPRPQMLSVMNSADILLNLNNLCKEQMPCKVQDYINSSIRVLNIGTSLFDEFINAENQRDAIYAVLSEIEKHDRITDYGALSLKFDYDNNLKKYLEALNGTTEDKTHSE